MSKYLILKFKNASLFYINKKTDDFIFNKRKNGRFKRIENNRTKQNFKEPITIFQISNVIHYLFGERPVPTNRDVFYKPIEYYWNKAENSYLKINNYKIYNKKKNSLETIIETVHIKKSVWNSFSKQTDLNWFKIKKYLTTVNGDTSLYNYFVNESNKVFNCNVTEISMLELKKLYLKNDKNYSHIIKILLDNGKTVLAKYLIDNDNNGVDINRPYLYGLLRTVNNGIDTISKLSGTIYVPVSDHDITRLREFSTGTCTILDGGLVYIDSVKNFCEIEDFYENDDTNLIKVSDISIEKTDIIKVKKNEENEAEN